MHKLSENDSLYIMLILTLCHFLKQKKYYLFKMCMYAIGCFKIEHTSIYEWQSWYPTPIPFFSKVHIFVIKLYELTFLYMLQSWKTFVEISIHVDHLFICISGGYHPLDNFVISHILYFYAPWREIACTYQ